MLNSERSRSSAHEPAAARTAHYDAVIVGAGFAGMVMLYRLRNLGMKAVVLEAGGGVGGTWYWNRYPGARCDVESMEYSYQFSEELQQEWDWSERYATQPEILRYANHVADRFDLRRDIRFNTRVKSAKFDETTKRWMLDTEDGASVSGSYCIMATGCLSAANMPAIPGRESFGGTTYHTGQWPHEGVDFTGKRVGIIGTGSSAIQSIPHIAAQAKHLFVFQRTPNYSVPARNGPMDAEFRRQFKAHYPELRQRAWQGRSGQLYHVNPVSALDVTAEEREREFQRRWQIGGFATLGAFSDLMLDKRANETAAEFVRARIREAVQDPTVADLLSPRTVFGCKRLCVDSDYFATYNRPNVTLVDISGSPIEAITPNGLRANGADYALDAIVFATGFDAMTGALNKIDIRNAAGRTLKDKWSEGPRTYLGLATAEFPNLFLITGPGSPSVLSNMLPCIEQHANWIAACLEHMRAKGLARIEANRPAEDEWVTRVNATAAATLFPSCNSWYLGANILGKPRVFMPFVGVPAYVKICEDVAANGYLGFALTA